MELVERISARKFILDALHLDRNLPTLAAAQQMLPEDWDYVSKTARLHRLGPMLHDRLGNEVYGDVIPQKVKVQFKMSQRKNAMRNLKIYRELLTVTKILEAENIPSIALKGAYLARFSYPNSGLRPMRDLDLLLKPEQVVEAFKLLKKHGYEPKSGGLPEAYLAQGKHLSPLISPEGVCIELHHRLVALNDKFDYLTSFDGGIWERSVVKMLGGIHVNFLCHEDMLLHLCIHATLDHQLDLGPLALVDVALLIEAKQIDWQDFVKIVISGNWQRYTLPLLYLAKKHLGANVPEEVLEAFGCKQCKLLWLDGAEYLLFADLENLHLLRSHLNQVLDTGGRGREFVFLSGIVFASRSVIAQHFPVEADSPIVLIYYPLYWLRLLIIGLPLYWKAFFVRKGRFRQLALHRNAFADWMHGG